MDKVKIGIVEDEAVIVNNLTLVLENMGYEVAEPAFSYQEAIKMIDSEEPDLLLLDINLIGSKTGIDLAWTVKEEYDIPFIFLTSNSDKSTIDKAKQVDPPAYLVKPFNKEDLYASIEIALFNFAKRKGELRPQPDSVAFNNSIFIKEKGSFVKVNFDEITYLTKDHVYIDLHSIAGKKYVIRNTMEEFQKKLPADIFFRVHRSYVINLKQVEAINHTHVTVAGEPILISKTYREDLFKLINLA